MVEDKFREAKSTEDVRLEHETLPSIAALYDLAASGP